MIWVLELLVHESSLSLLSMWSLDMIPEEEQQVDLCWCRLLSCVCKLDSKKMMKKAVKKTVKKDQSVMRDDNWQEWWEEMMRDVNNKDHTRQAILVLNPSLDNNWWYVCVVWRKGQQTLDEMKEDGAKHKKKVLEKSAKRTCCCTRLCLLLGLLLFFRSQEVEGLLERERERDSTSMYMWVKYLIATLRVSCSDFSFSWWCLEGCFYFLARRCERMKENTYPSLISRCRFLWTDFVSVLLLFRSFVRCLFDCLHLLLDFSFGFLCFGYLCRLYYLYYLYYLYLFQVLFSILLFSSCHLFSLTHCSHSQIRLLCLYAFFHSQIPWFILYYCSSLPKVLSFSSFSLVWQSCFHFLWPSFLLYLFSLSLHLCLLLCLLIIVLLQLLGPFDVSCT